MATAGESMPLKGVRITGASEPPDSFSARHVGECWDNWCCCFVCNGITTECTVPVLVAQPKPSATATAATACAEWSDGPDRRIVVHASAAGTDGAAAGHAIMAMLEAEEAANPPEYRHTLKLMWLHDSVTHETMPSGVALAWGQRLVVRYRSTSPAGYCNNACVIL